MFGHQRLVKAPNILNDMRKKYRNDKKKRDRRDLRKEEKETKRGNEFVNQRIEESKNARKSAFNEGLGTAGSLFDEHIKQGLDPIKRKAMQYEANKAIRRNYQAANRKLLGEQGQRGIGGKSGVAYAQQRDLARQAQEAEGGVIRDLQKLESDLDTDREIKRLAFMFTGGQGEAAQSLLDRQLAIDEMNLNRAMKEDRYWKNRASSNFSRV